MVTSSIEPSSSVTFARAAFELVGFFFGVLGLVAAAGSAAFVDSPGIVTADTLIRFYCYCFSAT